MLEYCWERALESDKVLIAMLRKVLPDMQLIIGGSGNATGDVTKISVHLKTLEDVKVLEGLATTLVSLSRVMGSGAAVPAAEGVAPGASWAPAVWGVPASAVEGGPEPAAEGAPACTSEPAPEPQAQAPSQAPSQAHPQARPAEESPS